MLAAGEEQREEELLSIGAIDSEWLTKRVLAIFELVDPLPFFDIASIPNRTALTGELAARLAGLGVQHLDLGDILGGNRLVSRCIADWVADASGDEGPLFGGIRYVSRIDNRDCFAVLERQEVRSTLNSTLRPDDDVLQQVAREYGLTLY